MFYPGNKSTCITCNPITDPAQANIPRVQILLNLILWKASKATTERELEISVQKKEMKEQARRVYVERQKLKNIGNEIAGELETDNLITSAEEKPSPPVDIVQSYICENGHICDICVGETDSAQQARDRALLYQLKRRMRTDLAMLLRGTRGS